MQMRQPSPGDAWERFCRLYGGAIIRYAMKLGLSETDSCDVLQETLVTLTRKMPQFDYAPERGLFRNFLLTIVHRSALRHFYRQERRAEISIEDDTTGGRAMIESLAAPVPLPADSWMLWQDALLDEAWSTLRNSGELQPQTIAVFEAYAILGESAEVVQKKFGLNANTIYLIRNRVVAMLKKEISYLLMEMDADEVIE